MHTSRLMLEAGMADGVRVGHRSGLTRVGESKGPNSLGGGGELLGFRALSGGCSSSCFFFLPPPPQSSLPDPEGLIEFPGQVCFPGRRNPPEPTFLGFYV